MSPPNVARRPEEGQQRPHRPASSTTDTTTTSTASRTASRASGKLSKTTQTAGPSCGEVGASADVARRRGAPSSLPPAVGGTKRPTQRRPPGFEEWLWGPLVRWMPDAVAQFREEAARREQPEEPVDDGAPEPDDGPPLLDRWLAVPYARWRAEQAGEPVPTGKRLTAAHLVFLDLLALRPTEIKRIHTKVGPATVMHVSVWQIHPEGVNHLGTADVFAESLQRQLPIGRFSVGTIVKSRGYAFVAASDDVTQAALAALPERGSR